MFVVLATVVAVTTRTTAAATSTCGRLAGVRPPATYAHVVWIWMENKAYEDVIGSSSAPYENQLARACGLATNYHGVANPSLPNYIAATSGSPHGISDDGWPADHPLAVPSLFGQVPSGSYEESMPTDCALTSKDPYAVKHNPQAYYLPVRARCRKTNRPLAAFVPARLPRFVFVTPNLCHDTHDCPVGAGDRWLRAFLPQVFATADYRAGRTVLFLTWDEGDSSDNHIPLLVMSASTRAGTTDSRFFDHYSLLRTTEQLLGVSELGAAARARSLRPAFHL